MRRCFWRELFELRSNAVVVGLLITLTFVLAAGCGKQSDIGGKLKAKAEERTATANKEITAVVDTYIQGMTDILPAPGTKSPVGQPPLMHKWRKQAAASKDLAKLCTEKAAEMGDTPVAASFKDGALLFKAVQEYWLGRAMKGPAKKEEWEDGYQDSLRVAAKDGAKEVISMWQHIASMKELGREKGGPWRSVADFELLLPHLMQVYQFRSYKGIIQATSFSRVWQVMFEFKRKMESDGPEQFQTWKDRLCREKLAKECDVPYEHREIVLRRLYLEKLIAAVADFRKTYEGQGYEPILDYFTSDLEKEKDSAVVPPEYPVLPDTRSPASSGEYTILSIGPKGAILFSDDPNEKTKRTSVTLMEARADWSLTDEEAVTLADKFVEAHEKMREDGAGVDYTTQVFYHFDKNVPIKVLGQLSAAYKGAGTKLIDFVGRARPDGSQKIRRIPGNAMDPEALPPVPVSFGPDQATTCIPIASLYDSQVLPDMVKHFVWVTKDSVHAGAAGKREVSAKLGGDLKKIGDWVNKTDKPTMIALKDTLTNQQLHHVFNEVALKCPDEKCVKPQFVSKLVVGICK